jgi:hypothetical protein
MVMLLPMTRPRRKLGSAWAAADTDSGVIAVAEVGTVADDETAVDDTAVVEAAVAEAAEVDAAVDDTAVEEVPVVEVAVVDVAVLPQGIVITGLCLRSTARSAGRTEIVNGPFDW